MSAFVIIKEDPEVLAKWQDFINLGYVKDASDWVQYVANYLIETGQCTAKPGEDNER